MLSVQGILLLLTVSIVVAAIMRAARCPGWPVVGGVIAGVLVGSTILGRAMPETYQRLYVGGIDQQAQLRVLESDDRLQREAMRPTDATEEELNARAAERAGKIANARSNMRAARWADQRPIRWFTFLMVGATLLAAGTLGVRPNGAAQSPLTPISIGAWSAALPGAFTFAAATWFGFPLVDRLIAASAVGVGAWTLRTADRNAADQAELGGGRMLQTATRVASVLALSALAYAVFLSSGPNGLKWLLPLLLLPIGWTLPAPAGKPGCIWSAFRTIVLWAAVPALAASCAIKIDFIDHFALWLTLLMIIFSGDGRMFGAFIGAKIVAPRKSLRAMRMVVGVMAAGPTQLAVLAVALHTWNIEAELGGALLLGALFVELLTPLRKAFAQRVVEIESNLEHNDADAE